MALAHINNRAQGGNFSGGPTIVSAAAAHTAGNGLIVLFNSQASSVISVANTAGDTWAQCGTQYTFGSNRMNIYYVNSTAGHATDVVTVTLGESAGVRAIVVHEISGQITSSMCNDSDVGTGTGTTLSTPSLTIVSAEEMIFALSIVNSGAAVTAGSGYTGVQFAITGDATQYFFDEWKIVTASEAPTATVASTTWAMVSASFKVAAFDTRFIKSVMPRVAVHRASSW